MKRGRKSRVEGEELERNMARKKGGDSAGIQDFHSQPLCCSV